MKTLLAFGHWHFGHFGGGHFGEPVLLLLFAFIVLAAVVALARGKDAK